MRAGLGPWIVASVSSHVADWVDLVVELLRTPSSEFPVDVVGRRLLDTFQSQVAALNWRKSNGSVAMQIVELDRVDHNGLTPAVAAELMREASNSQLMEHHPLARWHQAVMGSIPQSLGRVPESLTKNSRSAEVVELLHTVGADQELALPVVTQGRSYLAYSISRPGSEDYSMEDLQVAARIRPLLMAMHWQTELLGRVLPSTACDVGDLTGRELAVLQLLATGCTAKSISVQLGCSVRTVNKHLEHLYRKLGVKDKVSAVRLGEAEGWVHRPMPWRLDISADDPIRVQPPYATTALGGSIAHGSGRR